MSEFIITFGYGHHDEKGSLANCCTRIEAASEMEARIKIARVRGEKWSNSYRKKEGEKMITKYNVREIPFADVGPQIGENYE